MSYFISLKAVHISETIWMLLLHILTVPICNMIVLRQIELLLESLKVRYLVWYGMVWGECCGPFSVAASAAPRKRMGQQVMVGSADNCQILVVVYFL